MKLSNTLISTLFILGLSIDKAFSENYNETQEKKINILMNSVGENLFSSWFSGGDEIGAFINTEEEAKSLNIKSNEYNTFSFNDIFIHIPIKDNITELLKNDIKIEFQDKTKVFICDINTFFASPEQKSENIFDLALERYKIKSPFTKSKIVYKDKYKLTLNNKVVGYLISPENMSLEEIKSKIKEPENWEQKITLAFDSSIYEKKYDLMMITRNPNEGVKVQQTLKDIYSNMDKNSTLKISFGDFFSTQNDSEGRKIEIKNFIENSYDLATYSNRDFRLDLDDINEISKKTPIVVTNVDYEKNNLLPSKILNINNTNIGVLSFSENYYPKAKSYVDKNSKIKFLDSKEEVKKSLKKLLVAPNVDIILILSNIISSKNEIQNLREGIVETLNKYPEKQVIFVNIDNSLRYIAKARDYEKTFSYKTPNLLIELPIDLGIYGLEISFKEKFVSKLKVKLNSVDENKTLNSELKKIRRNVISEVQPFITNLGNKDVILPDYRDINKYLSKNNIVNKYFNSNDISYREGDRALIVSNILLEKFFTEIAIVSDDYGNSDTIGEISKAFFDEWFASSNSKLVFFNLYGKDLKQLNEKNESINLFKKNGILKFNGIDFKTNMVRGRAIKDDELYKIITTKPIFDNLLLQDIFKNAQSVEIKDDLKFKDEVSKYLENLLLTHDFAHKRFTDSYYSDLLKLFEDKSEIVSYKWNFSLKNIDLNYNKNQIFNNDNYSSIKDTRVNNPNQSNFGFSGKIFSNLDSKDLTLINSLSSIYNQSILEIKEKDVKNIIERKGQDDISFGNDLQLKFISLNLKDLKFKFIPYVNATYSTEFKPTINQQTQKENNRRSELNSTGGLLFLPGFIDEFRIALLSRYDFTSKTSSSLNPGIFMSFLANYDINNYSLILDGNFRHLFPQNNESPELLSTYGEVNAKLLIPIFNRLKLSLNANAFLFRGNLNLREQNLGYGFNAFAGINYSFDTKPIYGIFF